jgi:hypothetical protein
MSSNQPAPNPILVERDFSIRQDDLTYTITAKAVYEEPPFNQPYTLIITRGETPLEMSQPDEQHYTRDQARVAADRLFDSGRVKARIKENLKDWIHLHGLSPDSDKR